MTWFFDILTEIATESLAIVAYITVVVGWFAWQFRRSRSTQVLDYQIWDWHTDKLMPLRVLRCQTMNDIYADGS